VKQRRDGSRDDPTPYSLAAMPGLPDDWRPPGQVQIEKAWAEHEQHELLAELQRERDADGQPTWFMIKEPEQGDPEWVVVWFRAVDPLDTRPDIRITRFPVAWEAQQEADARAIADEHAEE
jgi:hypothetical protein